jgi:TetR/AcrR family transcriptional regulator
MKSGKHKPPTDLDSLAQSLATATPEEREEAIRKMLAAWPPGVETPDPGSPRGRILVAARRLFADRGMEGTSTRALAEAAGVNLAMIHYYFGSKERLYERVLSIELLSVMHESLNALPVGASPEEALVTLPVRIMEVVHRTPQWGSLFRREIAGGATHLRDAIRELGDYGPARARAVFSAVYEEAVRRGRLRPFPPDALRRSLIAIAYSLLFFAPFFSAVEGCDIQDETVWKEWTETLSTLLRRGMLAESAP